MIPSLRELCLLSARYAEEEALREKQNTAGESVTLAKPIKPETALTSTRTSTVLLPTPMPPVTPQKLVSLLSSSSATNQKTSSAPKYTDAEIEAAWVESSRTEATCAKDGVITYKNSLTGKTKTETIPATGEHSYELSEHVDSTCVNNGYDAYTCTICGDSYKDEIATTGHTEGEPQITKYASSFATGESKTYCTTCGELVATTTIPQTFPLPLSIVGAFGAGAVVFIIGALSLIKRK